ncbi:MAG: hypothetical protein RQM90_09790 [Methanoculleus sp.]
MRGPEDEIFDAVVTGRDGNYQFTFTPPVSGTYIATAEAYKDGYYIYGDQVTFISGEIALSNWLLELTRRFSTST